MSYKILEYPDTFCGAMDARGFAWHGIFMAVALFNNEKAISILQKGSLNRLIVILIAVILLQLRLILYLPACTPIYNDSFIHRCIRNACSSIRLSELLQYPGMAYASPTQTAT